jgi:hypothetical protein
MTGVCSRCARAYEGEVESDVFFDEIVANARYVFGPALDGEGYVVIALGHEKLP